MPSPINDLVVRASFGMDRGVVGRRGLRYIRSETRSPRHVRYIRRLCSPLRDRRCQDLRRGLRRALRLRLPHRYNVISCLILIPSVFRRPQIGFSFFLCPLSYAPLLSLNPGGRRSLELVAYWLSLC